jgi:hypothetical protein
MKILFHASFACVLGLVTACSDSSSDPQPTPDSNEIDSDGGTVSQGDASVEVPAGALESPTKIVVAESDVDVAPPDGYVLAGPAIAFTPHGLSFEEPVTLTLPYSSSADLLAVLRLDDEEDTSWEVVDGGSFTDGSATLEVSSFSIYAVAEESAEPAGMGGAGGTGEPAGMAGAEQSGGAPATGGAPSGGGDLRFSCDGTDPQSGLHICNDQFFPALIVELAGDDLVKGCRDPAVLVDMCDTTDAVIGCLSTDVDGLPGVTVTNWFYTGTAEDLMNGGVFCTEANEMFVDPP